MTEHRKDELSIDVEFLRRLAMKTEHESQADESLRMSIQKISDEIRTQDNRGTDEPIFIVQEKVRIWGLDSGYADEYRWINHENEGEEAEPGMAVGLDEQEHIGEDTSPWEKTYFLDRWEFVTACLTEAGCEAYIEADGHNHGELRIYAAPSYRNAEWRAVRAHLITLIL